MKHIYKILLIALFAPIGAIAQSWCPPGATWTFNAVLIFGGPGPTPEHLLRVEYVGDTVIGTQTVQQLDQWYLTYIAGVVTAQEYGGPLFTYVADDVVYLKQTMVDAYDTLFNFNAEPGDQWTVAGMGSAYDLIAIDTLTAMINGIPLRQLVVDASSLGLSEPDTITARIGFHYLFIRPGASFTTSLDGPIYGLRCYQDNELDFIRMPGIECGFALGISLIEEFAINLYPNPGNDHFKVKLPPGQHHFKILDALGSTVIEVDRISDQAVIDTRSLPSGLYHLQMKDPSGQIARSKWIKE